MGRTDLRLSLIARRASAFAAITVAVALTSAPPTRAGTLLIYLVPFAERSCEITAAGNEEIEHFVSDTTTGFWRAPRVVLIARAADEGSDDEMMRLAECRGKTVKAKLIRDGVVHAAIELHVEGGPDYWRRKQRDWSVTNDRTVMMYHDFDD